MTVPRAGAGTTAIPQPPAAERARTVAARPAAALHVADLGPVALSLAGTTAAGQVLVVVPAEGQPTAALRTSELGDLPARLTVTDRAPFPVASPVRGRVDLSGWLSPVPADDVRRGLLDLADVRPSDVLLDVGAGSVLLRLDPAEVLLTDGGATHEVDPDDYAAARPDPVSADEMALATAHGTALTRLLARVQAWAGPGDRVGLLGLDRHGVRFRVAAPRSRYDLRVPFSAALTDAAGLGAALDTLLTRSPA